MTLKVYLDNVIDPHFLTRRAELMHLTRGLVIQRPTELAAELRAVNPFGTSSDERALQAPNRS
jgi:hypothetical protein